MTLRFATWHMVLAFIAGFVAPLCGCMACDVILKPLARAACAIMCGVVIGLFVAALVFYNPIAGGGG